MGDNSRTQQVDPKMQRFSDLEGLEDLILENRLNKLQNFNSIDHENWLDACDPFGEHP